MTSVALVNRILAALLAIALLLGGLLAATEIVLGQLGQPAWLIPRQQLGNWLTRQMWDDTIIRLILAGLALVGLLLLLPALRRGRPRLLPVASQTPGVSVTVLRRGAERALANAASRASGVRGASAKVSRRRVKVVARTAVRSPEDVRQATHAAVTSRLADLGLDRLQPQIKVKRKNR